MTKQLLGRFPLFLIAPHLAFIVLAGMQVPHAYAGSSLYLHSHDLALVAGSYQLDASLPPQGEEIAPRVDWDSSKLTATFPAGTWTLYLSLDNKNHDMTRDVFYLYRVESDGSNQVQIGSVAMSVHRLSDGAGIYRTTLTFTGSTLSFKNERIRVHFLTPPFCTPANVVIGESYLIPPG